MRFRTEIRINKSPLTIEHNSPLLTIGSCFAENMGQKFKAYRFDVLNNPFGVLYNPASIYHSLELLKENYFPEAWLIYHAGEWHSFYHHSIFSHPDKTVCLQNIRRQLKQTRTFLEKTRHVIITLGTAFVYHYRESGQIVSNCHKIPASRFGRTLLEGDAITLYLKKILDLLRLFNPQMHIILSVSPIRHIKDGLTGNQISKTSLLYSIHKLTNLRENWQYFPSYEILIDDLRDYRFYEADLVHPNEMAKEYIWEHFREAYFSANCRKVLQELEPLIRARKHHLRNPQAPQSKKFIQNQLAVIKELKQRYAYLSFDEDERYFKNMITGKNQ